MCVCVCMCLCVCTCVCVCVCVFVHQIPPRGEPWVFRRLKLTNFHHISCGVVQRVVKVLALVLQAKVKLLYAREMSVECYISRVTGSVSSLKNSKNRSNSNKRKDLLIKPHESHNGPSPRTIFYPKTLKIVTWNIRPLVKNSGDKRICRAAADTTRSKNVDQKLNLLVKELKRYDVSVAGIQETK